MRPRLRPARVRAHPRAVHRQLPELHQPHPRRRHHQLRQQLPERPKVLLPELADRPVRRTVPRRQHHERHVRLQPRRDPPRRIHPRHVRVHQHLHHHRRMVRLLPPPVSTPVARVERFQIHRPHKLVHVVRQVLTRQPLPRIRRQQAPLRGIVVTVRSHAIQHGFRLTQLSHLAPLVARVSTAQTPCLALIRRRASVAHRTEARSLRGRKSW